MNHIGRKHFTSNSTALKGGACVPNQVDIES